MRNKLGFVSVFTLSVLAIVVLLYPAKVAGQDQATVAKDSIQVTAWTNNSYKGNFDVWSWVPKIKFRVNGPIPSGGQLYVEFTQPGGNAPWVKFDCGTQETQKGRWWEPEECGGRQIEDKSITAVGVVNFAIKLRNELAGGDTTLFTGKAKVEKTLSNEHGPKAVNKFVYFVNHDWNLPIGYVYYTPRQRVRLGLLALQRRLLGARRAGAPRAAYLLQGAGNRQGFHGRQADRQAEL